jgi:predicted SnoaL-like aldol condensation-catalyzing enzyme
MRKLLINNIRLRMKLGLVLALLAGQAVAQVSLAPPHAPLVEGLPVPVTAHPDQLSLLEAKLPALATNKRLIFDMWRTVMTAGHANAVERFFSANFQQHSPVVRNGRDALREHVAANIERQNTIPDMIPDLVTLIAERDFVVLAQVSHYLEPDGSGATYTSTRFDVFRIEGGQIAAQWTSDQLRPGLNMPTPANGGPQPVVGIQGLAQYELLFNDDAQLFANKRLAYDLWRHLPEAGREEMAELYLDEIYIQHNPNAATGREGVKEYFSQRPDSSIDTFLEDPLVAVIAEGDLVVQVLQEERPHPDTGVTYYVAWIDMFRIKDGLIIEHWDTASKGEFPLSMQ